MPNGRSNSVELNIYNLTSVRVTRVAKQIHSQSSNSSFQSRTWSTGIATNFEGLREVNPKEFIDPFSLLNVINKFIMHACNLMH